MSEKTSIEKEIDRMAWWIPIRSLRDKFRNKKLKKNKVFIEFEQNKLIYNNNCIVLHYGKYLSHMAQYYRNNKNLFFEDIEKFKIGMDNEDLKYLEYFINQVKIAPTEYNIREISIPISIINNIYSDEQIFLYFNKDLIYNSFIKENSNADFLNINLIYFQRGLYYIPNYIKEKLKDTLCIDCGAYIGDSPYIFSKYNFIEIHAFEPVKKNCEAMLTNLQKVNISNIVTIHNVCVGDEKGNMEIQFDDQYLDMGASILHEKNNKNLSNYIDIVKLDDVFKNRKNKIGLIKADVEGYEEKVLIGAENIIKEDKPILLLGAYHDWLCFGQGFRIKKWIEELNLGYKILFRQISCREILTFCIIAYIE